MKRLLSYSSYVYVIVPALALSACSSSKKTATGSTHASPTATANRESKTKKIKETYANLLGVSTHDIDNVLLYSFIDDWYGVPYKLPGRTKQGVDCSDFVSILYDKVFGTNLCGTCVDMFSQCRPVKEADLKEGDLVFFIINGTHVSHMGVYLQNHKFVHASVHSGVVISDLTTAYYKKYFYKGGRPKISLSQNTFKG